MLPTRDLHLLASLDLAALTAEQLLALSQTFNIPFSSERRVRERLHLLRKAGLVRSFPYAALDRGPVLYHVLTLAGHRLLHGPEAALPSKRAYSPIAVGYQRHAYALSEFVVHTVVSAHRSQVAFGGYYRENAFRIPVGAETIYPDAAFQLLPPVGPDLGFLVEIDNCTERVRSAGDLNSWERKIRLYDAFQDRCAKRFRVLIVTTRSTPRLGRILTLAGSLQKNRNRHLFYGVALPDYLAATDALRAPIFHDHQGEAVSLVPCHAALPIARPLPVIVASAVA